MATDLDVPPKLTERLLKTTPDLRAAFHDICKRLGAQCPAAQLKDTARYGGAYVHGKIFAYIDPQTKRIHFGFLREDADSPQAEVSLQRTQFSDWNSSEELVGYDLQSIEPAMLRDEIDDIMTVLEAAYQRAEARSFD